MKTKDYEAVLEALKEMVPNTEMRLSTVTADFEKAVWNAFGRVYPNAEFWGVIFIGHRPFGNTFKKRGWPRLITRGARDMSISANY